MLTFAPEGVDDEFYVLKKCNIYEDVREELL